MQKMTGKSERMERGKRQRYGLIGGIAFLAVLCILAVLWKKGKGSLPEEDVSDPYSGIAELPLTDVLSYCIGPDETLYVSRYGENAILAYSAEGECLARYSMEPGVLPKMEEGRESAALDGEAMPSLACLCYANDRIYCFSRSDRSILCLDTVTGQTEKIWDDSDKIPWVLELAVQGDILAVLYEQADDDCDRSIREGRLENYSCAGERLGFCNLRTKEWKELEYHNLVTVAAMGEQGFLAEGFDAEHGFYLAAISREGVMGERRAAGFTGAVYFDWDEKNDLFHGAVSSFGNERKCISGTPEHPRKAYQYWSNQLWIDHGSVHYSNGYLYLLTQPAAGDAGGRITRLSPESFFKNNAPFKAYIMWGANEPDWQGHLVETEVVAAEELAFRLLAGDSDFDFVVLNSGMAEAWNMKRVGSYYPLDQALDTQLSGCFEGVQQLVRDGERIWCCPLELSLHALVFSEENLREYGTTMSGVGSMGELTRVAEQLYEEGGSGWYELNWRTAIDYMFCSYILCGESSGKVQFQREEFYELLGYAAELPNKRALSSRLSYDLTGYRDIQKQILEELGSRSEAAHNAAIGQVNELYVQDILLQLIVGRRAAEYDKYIGKEKFSICRIPTAGGAETGYTAFADILVVNPASERRKEAARLAGDIASVMLRTPENYLSADRSLYPEDSFSDALYRACAEAKVAEVLPQSVYERNYYRILNGEVSRAEGIEELERVVNAYLFE